MKSAFNFSGGFGGGGGAGSSIASYIPNGSALDTFFKEKMAQGTTTENTPETSTAPKVSQRAELAARPEEVKMQGVHLDKVFIVKKLSKEDEAIGLKFQRQVTLDSL